MLIVNEDISAWLMAVDPYKFFPFEAHFVYWHQLLVALPHPPELLKDTHDMYGKLRHAKANR